MDAVKRILAFLHIVKWDTEKEEEPDPLISPSSSGGSLILDEYMGSLSTEFGDGGEEPMDVGLEHRDDNSVEENVREEVKKLPMCDSCEEAEPDSVAYAYCSDCGDHLCEGCYESHQQVKSTRFHSSYILAVDQAVDQSSDDGASSTQEDVETTAVDDETNNTALEVFPMGNDTKCSIHHLFLKYYCTQCHQLICSECGMTEHNGHIAREVSSELLAESRQKLRVCGKTLATKKEVLKNVISNIELRARQIQPCRDEVEVIIKDTFMELYDAVRSREEELLSECHHIAEAKESFLINQQRTVESLFECIDHCYTLSDTAANEYTDMQLLSVAHTVLKRAKMLKQRLSNTPTDVWETADIAIEADSDNLTTAINDFGCIFDGSPCFHTIAVIPRRTMCKHALMTVDVISRDTEGKTLSVKAIMAPIDGDDCEYCEVRDNLDGTFIVLVKPTRIGRHELCITINNGHVQGSPFTIDVVRRRDYTKIKKAAMKVDIPSPKCITVAANGNVFATICNSIMVFNCNGEHLNTFHIRDSNTIDDTSELGTTGDGPNCINKMANTKQETPEDDIYGIAIHGDVVYVVNYKESQIHKLSIDGELLGVCKGEKGTDEGQLSTPCAVAVSPDGKVYVSDNNNRVQAFNQDWSLSHVISSDESIQLGNPEGLAFDLYGNVHIACRSSNAVLVYSPKGNFVRQYDKYLSGPSDVAIDSCGYSIVSNYNSGLVAIYDPFGKFVRSIKAGSKKPWSVAVSSYDGGIWVAYNEEGKLLKY